MATGGWRQDLLVSPNLAALKGSTNLLYFRSPNFIHKQPQTLRLFHIIIASPVICSSLYTNVFLWSKRSQNLELFNNILQQRRTLLLGKLPIRNRFMELYCHHVEPRGSDWQQERVLIWIFLLFSPRYRCTLVFWLSENNNNNQPIISTIEYKKIRNVTAIIKPIFSSSKKCL